MKKWTILLIAGLVSGCGSAVQEHRDGTGVQWPELKALDTLSAGAEIVIERGDEEKLRQLADQMKVATIALADAPLPPGVKNSGDLERMLGSLKELAATLDDPEHVHDAVRAFHPVVEKLMETAGVPHTHDHHDHAGHDHSDHDHSDHDHSDHSDHDHGDHDH